MRPDVRWLWPALASYAALLALAVVAFAPWWSIPDWLGWAIAAISVVMSVAAPVFLAGWLVSRRR